MLRFFFYFGAVEANKTANFIADMLKEFSEHGDNAKMMLFINSPGGDIAHVTPIAEVLRATKVKLVTVAMGTVASAGSALFALGDERIVTPGTQFMIHHGKIFPSKDTASPMTSEELIKKAEWLTAGDEQYINLFKKTAITKKIFETKCSDGKDWYLTEDELVRYNVVTREDDDWPKLLMS